MVNEYDDKIFEQNLTTPDTVDFFYLLLEMVKKDGSFILWMKSPSEEVKLETVKQNGHSIKYIQNPSEEVKLEAVKQNGYSIQYIKNPSIEIQKLAIHLSGYDIKIIVLCLDWEEFTDELENNMMIKDIIE